MINAFDRPNPERALEYLDSLGFEITGNTDELLEAVAAGNFSVAQVQTMDMLQDMRDAVRTAIADGTTFEAFKENLRPLLTSQGWIGNGVNIGSRLQTIFRTNVLSAYNAGRFEGQRTNKKNRPYLMLIEIEDAVSRHVHASRNGSIARVDSQFFKKWYPPNGFGCRGRVRALTLEQARRRGIKINGAGAPDQGFDRAPTTSFKPNFSKYDRDIRRMGKRLKRGRR